MKKTIEAVCREGICPNCNARIHYDGFELVDNGGLYDWYCTECGMTGKEGYNMIFDGQHYTVKDKDGNEVEIKAPSSPAENEGAAVPVPDPCGHPDDDLLCEAGDIIENAVYQAIQSLCPVKLEWDMALIGPTADAIEAVLKKHGKPTCRPWEDENQNICYSLEKERCAHCTRCKAQSNHPKLTGYFSDGTCELNSVQEVAEFICQKGLFGDLIIYREDGSFFLNTFGIFIDRIVDLDYRQKLLEVLIPMQMAQEQSLLGTQDEEEAQV